MRFIKTSEITKSVAELCVRANTCINADIRAALVKSRETEDSPAAANVLEMLLENADIAEAEKLAVCQDTGMAVVFVKIGSDVHVCGDISGAINEGVRQGYKNGYFRNSIVRDPVDRVNTGDNTPAVIYYDIVPGRGLEISLMAKGFGSENMSAVKMLEPSAGIGKIEDFIVQTVASAGANPCPPVIIGVGIGGTMDKAALMAKQALMRDIGSVNSEKFWADCEERLLENINLLNIGPAGYGGKTSALAVHILKYPTHIAGLPVAVNIGCHASRHKTVVL
ncbi:MAG: fumarate hydratase [Oscillospiraceae bacterium]|nr:fumarate hydratase [Oscillospiraceae bacterium]